MLNKIFSFVLAFIIISSSPLLVFAAKTVEFNGLVPKCNTGDVITIPAVTKEVNGKTIVLVPAKYEYENPCDFEMVMAIINKVITFLLVTIATPLFALILIYVGWIYLSAGGSPETVTKAKHIFKNVIIGYVIALAAWLIVKTILSTLGFEGETFLG